MNKDYARIAVHDHPLSLLRLRGKNDSKDCAGCWEPISSTGCESYACNKCNNFALHKLCAEAPQIIEHPNYGLMTIAKKGDTNSVADCYCCFKKRDLPGLYYQNSMFKYGSAALDFHCASLVPSLSYKDHSHPLTLVNNFYNDTADCNICNSRPCDSLIFRCLDCTYNLHAHCVPSFLPSTSQHTSICHPGLLALTDGEDGSLKGIKYCRICKQERSRKHKVYHCAACSFVAHVHCVISFEAASSRAKEMEHLPSVIIEDLEEITPDPTENIDNNAANENDNMYFFRRDIHDHLLILQFGKKYTQCVGCWRPILDSDQSYSCTQCNDFVIHKLCGEAPKEINHPNYGLVSIYAKPQESDWGSYRCPGCEIRHPLEPCLYYYTPFDYSRTNCFQCAYVEPTMIYEFHNHPLSLVKNLCVNKVCHRCRTEPGNSLIFRCTVCWHVVHLHCVPSFLPRTVEKPLKCHPGPLTLTDDVGEDSSLKGICCQVCKEERIPGYPFYQCADCGFVAHYICVISFEAASSLTANYIERVKFTPILSKEIKPLPSTETEIRTLPCIIKRASTKGDEDALDEMDYRVHHSRNIIHQHPLILRVQKENKECVGCWRPISRGDLSYDCIQCKDFVLHKKCGEAPDEINHPTYGVMSLYTEPPQNDPKFDCRGCGMERISPRVYYWNPMFYHVKVDFHCASLVATMTYKDHEHPLTLLENFYENDTECKFCKSGPCTSLIFRCLKCRYNLHSHCAPSFLPSTVTYEGHVHPVLSLTHNVTGDGSVVGSCCHICKKERIEKHPIYHCEDCAFLAHYHCVISYGLASSLLEDYTKRTERDDMKLLPFIIKEEILSKIDEGVAEGTLAHTIIDEEAVEIRALPYIIKCAPTKIGEDAPDAMDNKSYFRRAIHQHPLVVGSEEKDTECAGCWRPILGGDETYACTLCDYFVLHKSCGEAPEEIDHPIYGVMGIYTKGHTDYEYDCRGCKMRHTSPGIYYWSCKTRNVTLDFHCASLVPTMTFEGHEHPLVLVKKLYQDTECNSCYSRPCTSLIFRCIQCDNYNVHSQCVPSFLPPTLNYQDHKHLLALADYSGDDGSWERFYCHICKKKRNPKNHPIYRCADCRFEAHVHCVITFEAAASLVADYISRAEGNEIKPLSSTKIEEVEEILLQENVQDNTMLLEDDESSLDSDHLDYFNALPGQNLEMDSAIQNLSLNHHENDSSIGNSATVIDYANQVEHGNPESIVAVLAKMASDESNSSQSEPTIETDAISIIQEGKLSDMSTNPLSSEILFQRDSSSSTSTLLTDQMNPVEFIISPDLVQEISLLLSNLQEGPEGESESNIPTICSILAQYHDSEPNVLIQQTALEDLHRLCELASSSPSGLSYGQRSYCFLASSQIENIMFQLQDIREILSLHEPHIIEQTDVWKQSRMYYEKCCELDNQIAYLEKDKEKLEAELGEVNEKILYHKAARESTGKDAISTFKAAACLKEKANCAHQVSAHRMDHLKEIVCNLRDTLKQLFKA